MESPVVQYGRHRLHYRLRFADRATLEISVLPDRSVEVVAPVGTDDAEIAATVRRRARWIIRQQRYFDQFVPRTPPRRFVSGETHLYLGRQYRLKVVEAKLAGVKLARGHIFLATPEPKNADRNRALLTEWYDGRARLKFGERMDAMFAPFDRMNLIRPPVTIRSLSLRWGSLSANGRISLNRDLIRAPTRSIDYVITHELCHLVHKDHDQPFYDLLDRLMPDWQARKTRLERVMA